jgi:hypothetical protein
MERSYLNRDAERKPVTLSAKCRTMSGVRDEGVVSDLSAKGCCVTTRGLFVQIGARVIIKPDGLEGITGIVRWIAGNRAGIEFDNPLYGPVFDHLTQRHGGIRTVGVARY